jgi:hypothetical protein
MSLPRSLHAARANLRRGRILRAAAAAAALAWVGAVAPLHAASAEAGFVPLFNGRDLTGWCFQDTGARFDGLTETPDGRFSAAGGILTVHAHAPRRVERLFTVRQFPRDFVLRLEFRASVNADSGIFLRRPQLQCRDYLVAGPYKSLTRYRPQAWNEIEVVVTGNVARCTCNGELLEQALVLPSSGGIGLEADRGEMEYRNIRLRELP